MENKPGVIGATIVTHSGRYFDFIDPQPEQITIEDIAHGLAKTCRFGGQSLDFYSVAQHSVLVSYTVPEEHALAALMHDAAEAYVGDIVGPLKQLLPDFKAIEKRVEAAIFQKFGIPLPLPECVKHADLRLLRTEQRDLTAGHGDNWNGLDAFAPLPEKIVPLNPAQAVSFFLNRWDTLRGVDDYAHRCEICGVTFTPDDDCLTDINLGTVHAACCGPEPESYVDLETGEPLKPGDPLPTPFKYGPLDDEKAAV